MTSSLLLKEHDKLAINREFEPVDRAEYLDYIYLPVNLEWLGGPEEQILEENDDFLIGLYRMGRKVKLNKGVATLPLPMNYPVKNMDDCGYGCKSIRKYNDLALAELSKSRLIQRGSVALIINLTI